MSFDVHVPTKQKQIYLGLKEFFSTDRFCSCSPQLLNTSPLFSLIPFGNLRIIRLTVKFYSMNWNIPCTKLLGWFEYSVIWLFFYRMGWRPWNKRDLFFYHFMFLSSLPKSYFTFFTFWLVGCFLLYNLTILL